MKTAMQELIDTLTEAANNARKRATEFKLAGMEGSRLTSEAMGIAYDAAIEHAKLRLGEEEAQMDAKYGEGYSDATKEAVSEIRKNYHPNI